jgi:hypothetical protein
MKFYEFQKLFLRKSLVTRVGYFPLSQFWLRNVSEAGSSLSLSTGMKHTPLGLLNAINPCPSTG